MNRLPILLVVFLLGCSTAKAPVADLHAAFAGRPQADTEIDISTGEVDRFVDSNGFIYMRGPSLKEKQEWLEFTAWVLRYDRNMPRQCIGYLKTEYQTLFHNLEDVLELDDLYVSKDDDSTVEMINHEISYRLRVRSSKGVVSSSHIQFSLDKSKRAEIVSKTVGFFDGIGLNPFEWKPRRDAFERFECTWQGAEVDVTTHSLAPASLRNFRVEELY